MKPSVLVAFLLLWLSAGCGKVGDPRPPSIRVPARITDLKAQQDQYTLKLSWTNPSRYADGSKATDLLNFRILQNGNPVFSEKINGPGMPQSHELDVHDAIGTTSVYSIVIETTRGKDSAASIPVSISIVETPGMVTALSGAMDQHRIRLEWHPPAGNPSFDIVYIVQRTDNGFVPKMVSETYFDDAAVEESKDRTYSYIVTAAREGTPPVPGPASPPLAVPAADMTRPAAPAGLKAPVVSGNGAILSWDQNTEADWAGYWVYRGDNPNGPFTKLNSAILTINSFRDDGYRPGSYYTVSAEDMSGNEGSKASPVTAP